MTVLLSITLIRHVHACYLQIPEENVGFPGTRVNRWLWVIWTLRTEPRPSAETASTLHYRADASAHATGVLVCIYIDFSNF